MRKLYLSQTVIFIAVVFSQVLIAASCSGQQLSQVVSSFSIYSPPSPNAAALLRYANVPVDEHTGIPSVVLPIDQLQGRQLSVPVTLSYHASGNKVQDIASDVGLGFVLNAGGVITRVMRGLPDEQPNGYQYVGKRLSRSTGNIDSAYLDSTINNKTDGEPDMFYLNFLGHTGKLIVDTNGNAQYLPDAGMRVISHPIHNNPDSSNNAWVIKDFTGTTYIFGADTTSREVTKVYLAGKPGNVITYTSSWYLAKVITPDGKETVNFNYNTGPVLTYEQYRNVTTYVIQDNNTDTRTGIFSGHVRHTDSYSAIDVNKIDVSTFITVLNPKYISAIQNDMGSVNFSYTSRLDLSGGQALNQIMVYNVYDSATPLKTYTLNESYFVSPGSSIVPDSSRLRLDCVTMQGRSAETKQLFVLTYNEQVALPPRNSDNFDHWGYYTTLNLQGGYPPVNLAEDNGNYYDVFEERAPDSTRTQAWMLTKVRNVNGGYTNFTYALDDYQFNNLSHFGGGLRIKTIVENDSLGQVVPLVKQYAYLLDNGLSSGMIYNAKPYYIQGILNYPPGTVVAPIPSLLNYYGTEFINPLTIISTAAEVALYIVGAVSVYGLVIDAAVLILAPAIGDAYDYLFHRTHHYTTYSPPFSLSSTPLDNLFDINGASVTYSEVSVINADHGKTVDYYTSQQDYPDSSGAIKVNFFVQRVANVYGNSGCFSPATSFDFERGLLKQSKAYDNNNNLVSLTSNSYMLSPRVSAEVGMVPSVSGYAALPNGLVQVITYDLGAYKDVSQNIQLVQSTTQLFDQTNNGNFITSTTNYGWEPSYPTLVNTVATLRSDGKTIANYTTYPTQFPSGTGFIDDMVSHYMWGIPIEQVSTLLSGDSTFITGGVLSRYKPGGLGLLDTVFSLSVANPIPMASFKFANQSTGAMGGSYTAYAPSSNYVGKAFYQVYDSKNNLIQAQNIGGPSSSIIWGYNQDVPIAQVGNAGVVSVAYTSFETNDQQYWQFTASGRDSSALGKTGKARYQLSSGAVTTTNSLPVGTYILSLWTQGTKPTIVGTTADVSIVNGESDNNSWNFYMDRITVVGGTQVSLSGSGLIDELRLYPQGAHMSSTTITPQVGVTSVASVDDKVNGYEYDALLRKATIRDDNYHILKQFSYANVSPVPCVNTQSVWIGINPVCFSDQTAALPNIANYSAIVSNYYSYAICLFNRALSESSYTGKLNYTVKFTDSTTYTHTVFIPNGSLSQQISIPLLGKAAEAIYSIGIDTVINFSNSYGQAYTSFQNRERVSDSYIEINSSSGGIGPYIAPVRSPSGCPMLFTNTAQTNFYRNNCTTGTGSVVSYTVPAGTYSGASQAQADSIARAAGEAYADSTGNCTTVDTTYVGINPSCITGTTHSGTPTLSAYSIAIDNMPQTNMFNVTLTRSTAEAAYDAIVTYKLSFIDGSTASYTIDFYMNQQTINFSPPLAGYSAADVLSITITGVVYSGLPRITYANLQQLLNGVSSGYTQPNTAGGQYYLAPVESPGACQTWYYNTVQTGFYRNNCLGGELGSSISYTIAAHTDSSTVSQAYADALARVAGQAYANSTGSCSLQPYVTTYAGSGTEGYVNGNAASAEFIGYLYNLAMDNSGNLYVDDYLGTIRKVDANGIVSTVGTENEFSALYSMITDPAGNLYISIAGKIDKVSPAGVVTVLAGGNNGYGGYADGQGTAALFVNPQNLAIDPAGNIYVIDGARIRKITPGGYVTTINQYTTTGDVNGPLSTAEFNNMQSITVDKSGNIYVFEYAGYIRKISNGMVTTVAGNGSYGYADGQGIAASFISALQMTTDANGNIYLVDNTRSTVRKVTPQGYVSTIDYNRNTTGDGFVNGPISIADFNFPCGIAIDASGNLYISDNYNDVIRKITFPQ